MEAPNRPKDGLLGPARVDRSGRRATTRHATGGGGWPEVSVHRGGGGIRYVGVRAVGWACRWGYQRGALREPLFCGGALHGVGHRR